MDCGIDSTILRLLNRLAFKKLRRPFRELQTRGASSGPTGIELEKSPFLGAGVDRIDERVVPVETAHQLELVRRMAVSSGK